MIRFAAVGVVVGLFVVIFTYMWFTRVGPWPLRATPFDKTRNIFDTTPREQAISSHQRALMKIGMAEHELGLLPHNDSWVEAVCTKCQTEKMPKLANNNLFESPAFDKGWI